MSKIDELRGMLEGQSAYWWERSSDNLDYMNWYDRNGELAMAYEVDGKMYLSCATSPEEAVATTTGRRAPLVVDKSDDAIESCWCGHCNMFLGRIFDGHFCPRCGWEVEL